MSEVRVAKVDEGLGIVFGWAIVCKQDGEEYVDLDHDHIPERAMLKSAARFAEGDRPSRLQHSESTVGRVVFMMPITEDIAKAFGIDTSTTGLAVGVKVDDATLARFRSGELTGFSIGGSVISSRSHS